MPSSKEEMNKGKKPDVSKMSPDVKARYEEHLRRVRGPAKVGGKK